MYSAFNNLQAMKVNFRNRKIHLNLPKNQLHKPSDPKDSEPISRQMSSNNLKNITSVGSNDKKIKNSPYERIQMDPSKQSYIDSLADIIHLIGHQYVEYLNEGKQDRFRAAILSNLTKLQARDRKIIIEYNFSQNSQGQAEFNFSKEEQKFKEWLGGVHFRVVSTSFDFQISKLLTSEEVKVYCCQNLLLNIILFIEKVQSRIQGISLTDFMIFIDQILHQNIEYLMVKYPQAKQMKPNKRLRAEIQPINNMQNDVNDMLQFSKVQFKLEESQNYNSQIMKFINYLIEKMTLQTQIQGEKYSFADGFYEIMEQVFQMAYIPQSLEHDLKQKKKNLAEYKKQISELFQSNKQVKQYKQKVSKYTSYKMGTKINPNTQTFSESEIKAGFFEVKSTSILRILTKWIEELEKKIFQAKQYIQKRSFRFKNANGGYSKLNASQKNDFFLQATKQVESLKMFIKNIRQNAFSIEGQLAMTMKQNKERINIPKHEYMVGEFSSKLQDAASSSLLSYLNQIIHILLLIPMNTKSKYIHDEQLSREMDINLITFKISDLLRCKFSSHQNQILRVYKELKRISDEKDYFKIVRIKDRLELGTRDILINVSYKNVVLCQIQLAITDQIDTKQQAFDAFNHFLYELKRSNLGSIMESACIWAHFDQRSRIFKKIKQKQIQEYYLSGLVKRVVHNCKEPLVDNQLPFVCSICSKFYFSQQGIIKHKKCLKCLQFNRCALCLENKMSENELKQFLGLDKSLGVFSQDFIQWTCEQYPRNGIIIPKKNKKVEVYFFTTILWKEDAYVVHTFQVQNKSSNSIEVKVDALIVVKNNELKEWKKLKENYIIYEWEEKRNINKTLKPQSIAQEQLNQQLRKQEEERQKWERKQKEIEQIKKKWKIKTKRDKQRPGSACSNDSKQSKQSKKSIVSKQSEQQNKKKGKAPAKSGKNKILHMPTIDQEKKIYNESIAKKSDKYQVRIAQKKCSTEDQFVQKHYLILGPYLKQKDVRAELKKINNFKVIRENLQRKMQVLFLQDLLIEDELCLEQNQYEKYSNSLSKINQIYLDSNLIEDLKFLQKMPKLNVVHLSTNLFNPDYNLVKYMQSFETLKDIAQVMLEYNQIQKITGLEGKQKLTEINLNHNFIEQIKGIQRLGRLQVLNLADNKLKLIQGLGDLKSLKKLDLSFNYIQRIEALQNLVKLEELDLSDNYIRKIQNLSKNSAIKKLDLCKNRINKIQGLTTLKELKFLDLHRNKISKIQNLQVLSHLIFLNLAGNKIRKIEGLKSNVNITELNLSQNQILSLRPLVENNLTNVKSLDMSYNGVKKLFAELFEFMPSLQQFFINQNPLKMTKNQRAIHENLCKIFQQKSNFPFRMNMDAIQTVDTDSQQEEQEDQKQKNRRNSSLEQI